MSSDTIQSILTEKRVFPPSAEFTAGARLNAEQLDALHAAAAQDHVGFWAELARKQLAWQTPFTRALDDSNAPNFQWFTDGRTNASVNCLDRHLAARGDKIAIRFEGEKGDTRHLSYRQLHAEVCKLANGLKSLGIAKGAAVICLETRGEADGHPVSRATTWFDARRFAGIEAAMAETGSITASLKRFGINDYLRQSTVLSARHADAGDLAALDLQPGAIVLVTAAVNVTLDGQPIQFAESRFPAERVELRLSANE